MKLDPNVQLQVAFAKRSSTGVSKSSSRVLFCDRIHLEETFVHWRVAKHVKSKRCCLPHLCSVIQLISATVRTSCRTVVSTRLDTRMKRTINPWCRSTSFTASCLAFANFWCLCRTLKASQPCLHAMLRVFVSFAPVSVLASSNECRYEGPRTNTMSRLMSEVSIASSVWDNSTISAQLIVSCSCCVIFWHVPIGKIRISRRKW